MAIGDRAGKAHSRRSEFTKLQQIAHEELRRITIDLDEYASSGDFQTMMFAHKAIDELTIIQRKNLVRWLTQSNEAHQRAI